MAAIAAMILLAVGFGFWADANRATLRKNKTLLSIYRSVRKISDIMYLPYYFRQDEIPSYEIELDPRDIRKMDESLPEVGVGHAVLDDRVYVPARFSYQGIDYEVEIRYRGDEPPHWTDPKKSYLVKFKKGEQFKGMNRISFIIVDDRKFALEHFNNWRAKKFGLRVPESGFANLRINGKSHGLYFMIENWNEDMFDEWGIPKTSGLFGDDDTPEVFDKNPDFLWQDRSAWKVIAGESNEQLGRLLDLLNKASDEEFNFKIFELLDKDNFYAWQADQELMNSVHQNSGNVRLLFDAGENKFFFIPWDVSSDPAENDNFGQYGALARRIFKNPQYLQEKNALLRAYIYDEKNLMNDLKFYDETWKAMQISLYKDRLKIYPNRYADEQYRFFRQEIIDNFERLKRNLP